jgi:hypothetical protein
MRAILILIVVSTLLASCNKGDEGSQSYSKVNVKGHFGLRSADVSAATQVVMFNIDGNYSTSPITGGSFSIQINKDQPVGLIFTNESKSFLGYLTLGQGIESLPLNYLNDTVSTVDLGLLTSNNTAVQPQINPLSGKMNMSNEEIKGYRQASVNFSALVKNPDTDRNGIIDMLEGKYYHIAFLYFGDGSNFTTTPSKSAGVTPAGFRIMFMTTDPNTPASVTFSNEDGTLTMGTNQKKSVYGSTIYFSEMINNYSPTSMNAKILYNNKTLYFEIPDQSGTLNNAVFVFPTLQYNSSNKLSKISWEYYSGLTGAPVDASKIILNVMAQVSGTDYSVRLYDSQNYDPEVKQDVLANPIDLSAIGVVNMAYYDIFGNNMVIGYRHQ